MTEREFTFAVIPGLEKDLNDAQNALRKVDESLEMDSYLWRLRRDFIASGLEEKFQLWNKGLIFPEAMRRELFLLNNGL